MYAVKHGVSVESLGVQLFRDFLWREARPVSNKEFSEIVDSTLE
jgi:hypothetical protein